MESGKSSKTKQPPSPRNCDADPWELGCAGLISIVAIILVGLLLYYGILYHA